MPLTSTSTCLLNASRDDESTTLLGVVPMFDPLFREENFPDEQFKLLATWAHFLLSCCIFLGRRNRAPLCYNLFPGSSREWEGSPRASFSPGPSSDLFSRPFWTHSNTSMCSFSGHAPTPPCRSCRDGPTNEPKTLGVAPPVLIKFEEIFLTFVLLVSKPPWLQQCYCSCPCLHSYSAATAA